MEKTINEIKIKIVDSFPIDTEYNFDDDLSIFLRGEIINRLIKNNQDNSVDIVLTFKAQDFKVNKN